MIFTDKYFTKAKLIAAHAGLDPVVSYRIFARCGGKAAMEPLRMMVEKLLGDRALISTLPTGVFFEAGDTLAIITGRFQDLVEYEPMWLWWSILPSYCALQAYKIVTAADGEIDVMAFENRHNFGAEATALTSYGAMIGGIRKTSCEIGTDPLKYLSYLLDNVYKPLCGDLGSLLYLDKAIGTMPHALLAIFEGDYKEACLAYKAAFPDECYTVLNDYNNREIDDSLIALSVLGERLYAIRCDTCGENRPQLKRNEPPSPSYHTGISHALIHSLRGYLDKAGGEHVKICVSSGFDSDKLLSYLSTPINSVGTGSFIPKWPIATADIFEVNGKPETKKGREWGFPRNDLFHDIVKG